MAKDKFHDTVVNALKKDGWKILKEQVSLRIGKRRLWIDIQAQNLEAIVILVEVKSYHNIDSDIGFLSQLLGQYILYRDILENRQQAFPLYLAIPKTAYKTIFAEEVGKLVLEKHEINLLIYDVETEEILEWISKS